MKKAEIHFQSIPGVKNGETCLTIHPPGTWMGNKQYMVFIGGGCAGRAKTLAAAKRLLLKVALEYCQRHINNGHEIAEHYEDHYGRLYLSGLKPKGK